MDRPASGRIPAGCLEHRRAAEGDWPVCPESLFRRVCHTRLESERNYHAAASSLPSPWWWESFLSVALSVYAKLRAAVGLAGWFRARASPQNRIGSCGLAAWSFFPEELRRYP